MQHTQINDNEWSDTRKKAQINDDSNAAVASVQIPQTAQSIMKQATNINA